MKRVHRPLREEGFALILTITLLALLVLVTLILASLLKVDTQLATAATYQTQARQNALLGLNVAVGKLQRHAGPDDRVTGMAGITGVPARDTTRQWAGVWEGSGSPVWLVSGNIAGNPPSLLSERIRLVGAGSVANPTNKTDQEFVEAGVVEVPAFDSQGQGQSSGRLAYWVGDQGVKLSAVLPAEMHALDQLTVLKPDNSDLGKVATYEQMAVVPTTVSVAVLRGQLRAAFHSLGLVHFGMTSSGPEMGLLNVNSSSARYWDAVGATYNRLKPGSASPLRLTKDNASDIPFGEQMAAAVSTHGSFDSVSAFLANEAVISAITHNGGELLEFGQTMQAWLTTRSDTFRIRAYGDAVNPVDATRVEARAWCEAIVQRIPELIDSPNGPFGRRFVITYFRWLGPDDI